VFEPLSQDEDYMNLAQLRYAAGCAHDTAPDAAEKKVFGAYNSAEQAVTAYVESWLADNAAHLVDEWDLEPSVVAAALEEYDLADDVEVPA
jgi:hypothetical protein